MCNSLSDGRGVTMRESQQDSPSDRYLPTTLGDQGSRREPYFLGTRGKVRYVAILG